MSKYRTKHTFHVVSVYRIHIETFIILLSFYFKYFQSAKMMKICCYTSWNDSWKPPTSSNINNGFQSFKFSILFIITHKLLPSITGRSVRFGKSTNDTQQRIFGCIRTEYFSTLRVRCAPWIPQDSRESWSRILGSNISEYFQFHAVNYDKGKDVR